LGGNTTGGESTTKPKRILLSSTRSASCSQRPRALFPRCNRSRIRWAAVYGSVARGEEGPGSDIDLLLVGDVATVDLLPSLRRIERSFGREVNLTRYSEKEFRDKIRDGDHFLKSVTKDKFVMLIGSLNDLEKAASRT
jgi:predicted nucleotidyltransferase